MPTRYDSEDDAHEAEGEDREISLGTGTVLGIFLALALVCSLFFGLGYSMGRRSAPPLASAATLANPQGSGNEEKPPPGRSAAPRDRSFNVTSKPDGQVTQPVEQSTSSRDSGDALTQLTSERSASAKPGSREHPAIELQAPVPSASSISSSATPSGAQSFVQVAAVSRKEDADLLLAALKRRGYAGLIRQQTLDTLLHVQVGPFPTKKDAEAMRQRLITDGYNPILK